MADTPTVEEMKLSEVITESKRLGIWTYLATASQSGRPYVTPVHSAFCVAVQGMGCAEPGERRRGSRVATTHFHLGLCRRMRNGRVGPTNNRGLESQPSREAAGLVRPLRPTMAGPDDCRRPHGASGIAHLSRCLCNGDGAASTLARRNARARRCDRIGCEQHPLSNRRGSRRIPK